jgi:enamine deaminase RidA (YjgF/YER057c/UK114 family)
MNRIDRIDAAALGLPGGHYSHAVKAGGFVFLSGQLPKPLTNAGFQAQARQALSNLLVALAAAGGGPRDVVKVTAFIVGVEHWGTFNSVFAETFGEIRPARSVVPTPELHHGYLIEVEAVAIASGTDQAEQRP